MRSASPSRWYWLPIASLFLMPSIASAQSRVEQGREVLNGVRAVHLMIDFGLEALDFDQMDSLNLAWELSRKEERADSGSGEWDARRGMLLVEKLARDMIAGKPVPEASMKIVDEHFKVPEDVLTGLRLDKEGARLCADGNRDHARLLQELAARLALAKPLTADELAVVRGRFARFRSGDQLTWCTPDVSFDVPRMVKAYSSAEPGSRHAMRVLFGLRGKADEQAVEFILNALKGDTPIERYDAALAAGRMRPPSEKLISALTGRLDDPDPRVARAAVRSLVLLDASQSAPAMVRRLRLAAADKEGALRDKGLGFAFEEYDISDSFIGFRHDLPTELIFALGRLRCREAIPLLWEIVRGKGEDIWQYEGIYELGHGGVAFEAIVAVGSDDPAAAARRALAAKSATVDARGAAANVLGERGRLADVPVLIDLMSRLDRAARSAPDHRFQTSRTMSRATFAAERLLFFADPADSKLAETRQALIAELRRCASGPFGEPMIAALLGIMHDETRTSGSAPLEEVVRRELEAPRGK